MRRIILDCYKLGSAGAKHLALALKKDYKKVLRIQRGSPTFKSRKTDYKLEWGNSNPLVVNKLYFFQEISKHNENNPDKIVNLPDWTTDHNVANAWGKMFFARTKLSAHSGEGIVIIDPENDGQLAKQGDAKLYVQYKKKKHEFRVHIFKGQVIDITQKKKRTDFEGEVNTKIRNHQNGWVYCRENIIEPHDLQTQALNAFNALGFLDFGAVDLIYNAKENKSYVLEINSAPGVEGTTVEKYKEAILKDIQNEI